MTTENQVADTSLKVFISYSRTDLPFARQVASALQKRGLTPIIDTQDLPTLEDWRNELSDLLREADAVVFIVSPRSVASPVCAWELEQVTSLSKRLAPIILERVSDDRIHEAVAKINYLSFEDPHDFEARADALARALQTDLDWIKKHTRFSTTARRWVASRKSASLMLRGQELEEAELWIASHPRGAPEAPQETRELILHSRRTANLRRRLATSAAVVLVFAGLVGFLLVRDEQMRAEREADLRLQAQSFSIAQRVDKVLSVDGDIPQALAAAIASLPDTRRSRRRPYVSQAEAALFKTLGAIGLDATLKGHTAEIVHLSFAGSTRLLASASADGTARIWNLETRQPVYTLEHGRAVLHVLFAKDDKRVFTASADGSIGVWSVETGTLIKRLEGHTGRVVLLAEAPDRPLLASASVDGTARIWSLDDYTGQILQHIAADWQPDKTDSGELAYRWSEDKNPLKGRLPGPVSRLSGTDRPLRYSGYGIGLTDLKWSPDGSVLLTAGEDGRVVAWSRSAERLFELPVINGPVFQVEPLWNRRAIAVGTSDLGAIWDVATRRKIGDFGASIFPGAGTVKYPVTRLQANADKTGLFGHVTNFAGQRAIYLWSAVDGRFLTRIRTPSFHPFNDMDVAAEGTLLLDGIGGAEERDNIQRAPDDNSVRLTFVGQSEQQTKIFAAHRVQVTAVRFSNNPKRFASGDRSGVIHAWDTADSFLKHEVVLGDEPRIPITSTDIAADGSKLVAISKTHARAWLRSGTQLAPAALSPQNVVVTAVAEGGPAAEAGLRPGDVVLQVGGEHVERFSQLQARIEASAGQELLIKIQRDGRKAEIKVTTAIVAAQRGGRAVRVGRIGITGTNRDEIQFSRVRFTLRGARLVGAERSGDLKAWDSSRLWTEEGYQPETVKMHASRVHSLGTSDDGMVLVSASSDVAVAWDAATMQPRRRIEAGTRRIKSVRLAPRGDRMLVVFEGRDEQRQPMELHDIATGAVRSMLPGTDFTAISTDSWMPDAETLRRMLPGSIVSTIATDGDVPDSDPMAFSNDGTQIYFLSSSAHALWVWNLATDGPMRHIEMPFRTSTLAVRSDGRQLAVADANSRIALIDPAAGTLVRRLDAFGTPIRELRFSQDGRRLLAASAGFVWLFDVASGELLWEANDEGPAVTHDAGGGTQSAALPDVAMGPSTTPDGSYILNPSRHIGFLYQVPATTQQLVEQACERLKGRDSSETCDFTGQDMDPRLLAIRSQAAPMRSYSERIYLNPK